MVHKYKVYKQYYITKASMPHYRLAQNNTLLATENQYGCQHLCSCS